LADYDHAHGHDMHEWGEPEPIQKPDRLDVTIAVRFTADEIAAVRQRATEAAVKPTVFIRRAALHSHNPLDRDLLPRSSTICAPTSNGWPRSSAPSPAVGGLNRADELQRHRSLAEQPAGPRRLGHVLFKTQR